MRKASVENGHTSNSAAYALSMPPKYEYEYPDMNLQRRALDTPYIGLLETPKAAARLNSEPRVKMVGDHVCRALVENFGFSTTKDTLEEIAGLLPKQIEYVAAASKFIEGKNFIFIGLDANEETVEQIASERDSVLRMLNTGFSKILDDKSRKTGNLIVGKFPYTERGTAVAVANELQGLVSEPLPIDLGSAILNISDS